VRLRGGPASAAWSKRLALAAPGLGTRAGARAPPAQAAGGTGVVGEGGRGGRGMGGEGRGGEGGEGGRRGKERGGGRGERGKEGGSERARQANPPPPTPPPTHPSVKTAGFVRAFTVFYCLLFLPDNRRFLMFLLFFIVFLHLALPLPDGRSFSSSTRGAVKKKEKRRRT
jgi:hypothetical protein